MFARAALLPQLACRRAVPVYGLRFKFYGVSELLRGLLFVWLSTCSELRF
jgi:hypothetical protein